MSEWKMEPTSLAEVLKNTGTAYDEVLGVITEQGMDAIFTGLLWGGFITQSVPQALSDVLQEQQKVNLQNIANHIGAGVTGVTNAAIELSRGNESMATTFESQMLSSASSGDFTYFEQHGHRPE